MRSIHRRPLLQTLAPGALLGACAVLAVSLVAVLDTLRLKDASLARLLAFDDVSAAWTVSLVGAAEGAAIAMVIVVVVLGVQLTADRYSPRVIDIFVRDRMNAAVLALFLGSILFTIGVGIEVKKDTIPTLGLYAAVALAVVDFSLLFPYIRYMFKVMRGETIIAGVRRRAGAQIAAATRDGDGGARHRREVREALNQISDIALGSIQEGDTAVALDAIHALREIVCDDYIALKPRLPKRWFTVGHEDMPGASEQTVLHVDRTGTWLEHAVLATFVDLIGETPSFRKEIIHAIALTTRDVGRRAVSHDDVEAEALVIRFFNTYLRAALNQKAPPFAYAVMNEYRRLAVDVAADRPDLPALVAEHMLRYGRSFDAAGMPFIIGTAAEDVGAIVIRLADHDHDRAILVARQLATTLAEMAPVAEPLALNGILKATIKLALWAITEEREEILLACLEGIRAVDGGLVSTALTRMSGTTERVFFEVSDRVVAFDYVEEPLRDLIPVLRHRLAGERPPAAAPRRRRQPAAVTAR